MSHVSVGGMNDCPSCKINYEIGYSRGRTEMLIEEIDADGPRFAKIIEEQRVFELGLDVDLFFKRRQTPGCDLIIKGQPAGEIKHDDSTDQWVIISALGEERGREPSLLAAKERLIKLVKHKLDQARKEKERKEQEEREIIDRK